MVTGGVRVRVRRVRDFLVACDRFSGDLEEVPARLSLLRQAVEDHIMGDPISLFYGPGKNAPPESDDERFCCPVDLSSALPATTPRDLRDVEICYPVRPAAKGTGVRTQILEGGEMLCATRTVPGSRGEPKWGVSDGLRDELRLHLHARELDLEDEPVREVHRSLPGGGTAVEAQVSLLFPRWLDRFRTGVVRHIRNPDRASILRGEARMGLRCSIDEQLTWVAGAIDRLEATCRDPAVVRRILQGCSHRVPPGKIAWLRSIYQRTGDLASVVEAMRSQWPRDAEVRLENGSLYAIIPPADPAAHSVARDEFERRVVACYRTIGRKALRDGTPLPRAFCFCGSGWLLQLWEGILRQPVEVDVVESILWGDSHCCFSVQLPPDAVRATKVRGNER